MNDVAERVIKLIGDYKELLTKNEDQKQFLLPVEKDDNRYFQISEGKRCRKI